MMEQWQMALGVFALFISAGMAVYKVYSALIVKINSNEEKVRQTIYDKTKAIDEKMEVKDREIEKTINENEKVHIKDLAELNGKIELLSSNIQSTGESLKILSEQRLSDRNEDREDRKAMWLVLNEIRDKVSKL